MGGQWPNLRVKIKQDMTTRRDTELPQRSLLCGPAVENDWLYVDMTVAHACYTNDYKQGNFSIY